MPEGYTDQYSLNAVARRDLPPTLIKLLEQLASSQTAWADLPVRTQDALTKAGFGEKVIAQRVDYFNTFTTTTEAAAMGGGTTLNDKGTGGSEDVNLPARLDTSASAAAQKPPDNSYSLQNYIKTWGLTEGPEIQALIDAGKPTKVTAKDGSVSWKPGISQAKFLSEIRQTQAYKDRFASIPADMNEATYLATEKQYHSIAAVLGIHLGDQTHPPGGRGDNPAIQGRERFLFANNVSPAEFQAKGEALVAIRDNPALFEQFRIELQNAGLATKGKQGLDQQHLLMFVMGQGDPAWHELWQNTVADNAAVQAGIKIAQGSGLYTGLSRAVIHDIADKGFSAAELASKFNEVSDTMLSTLPLAEARRFGVSKSDIVQASFGGPEAAQARLRISRARKQAQAFSQGAVPQGITPAEVPQVPDRLRQAQSEG